MPHTNYRAADRINDVPVSGLTPLPVAFTSPDGSIGNQSYTLFSAQTTSANSATAGPVMGGSYLFSGDGTFGSGTLKLQRLSQDGVTYVDIASASMTAAGSVGVVLGQGATVRAVLSGATAPSLYANLS